MVVYLDELFAVNTLINYLLLVGAARLSGCPVRRWRLLLAAGLGGLYAVGVLLPQTAWLQAGGMKAVIAAAMIFCAFGAGWNALRQLLLFLALSAALGGGLLALNLAFGGGWTELGGMVYYPVSIRALLLTAAVAYAIVTLAFSRLATHGRDEVRPVRLRLGPREVTVPALRDTGNSLRDPLTNLPVMVVEWQAARALLPPEAGALLSERALADPAALLARLRGVAPELRTRLIPYQAVGVSHALLLAVRCDEMTADGRTQTGALAALSPTPLSDGGAFHALTA